MLKKAAVLCLIGLLAVGVFSGIGSAENRKSIDVESQPVMKQTDTQHEPIYIFGNDQFVPNATNGVIYGTGTQSDPYVIDGWEINATDTHGIWITDTNVSFIIQNCYIYGEKKSAVDGILLGNVTNGIITNNVITNNSHGIFCDGATSDTFSYNTISYDADDGIYLQNSNYDQITHNNISFTYGGVFFIWCMHNQVHYNNFYNASRIGKMGWDSEGMGSNWNNNYWSDYTSPDSNGDGIVDNPYIMGGNAGGKDNYPHVNPIKDAGAKVPDFSSTPVSAIILSAILLTSIIIAIRRRL